MAVGLNELLYRSVSTVTVYISHQVMKKTGGLYPAPLRILDVSYTVVKFFVSIMMIMYKSIQNFLRTKMHEICTTDEITP